jgi:hypothetical protein
MDQMLSQAIFQARMAGNKGKKGEKWKFWQEREGFSG